jgi:exosortase A-associated hydrolase 2
VSLSEPLFLPGTAGSLFALYVPADPWSDRGVVLLPPFAEEMNRARRMLRSQAAALAQAGIGALSLDPFGTGDSAGNFADARWETWVADVRVAVEALAARGARHIGLLGLRLGATLAAAAAPTLASACFATVLWQPVVEGRRHLTEFLRVRTLPGAWTDGGPVAIETMRAWLVAEKAVEVAGYDVVPGMAAALDALDLVDLAHPALGRVTWLELVRDPLLSLSADAARCVAAWRASGLSVTTRTIPGPAFWTGQGNAVLPDLIAAATAAFGAAS